jgi:hypothetical protein
MNLKSLALFSAIVMVVYSAIIGIGSYFSFALTTRATVWTDILYFLTHFPIDWSSLICKSLFFLFLNGLFWGVLIYFISIGIKVLIGIRKK